MCKYTGETWQHLDNVPGDLDMTVVVHLLSPRNRSRLKQPVGVSSSLNEDQPKLPSRDYTKGV